MNNYAILLTHNPDGEHSYFRWGMEDATNVLAIIQRRGHFTANWACAIKEPGLDTPCWLLCQGRSFGPTIFGYGVSETGAALTFGYASNHTGIDATRFAKQPTTAIVAVTRLGDFRKDGLVSQRDTRRILGSLTATRRSGVWLSRLQHEQLQRAMQARAAA